jgi:flavin reductase (DIM6/NTAB) family NADH-FMN oxidoreductase RutF
MEDEHMRFDSSQLEHKDLYQLLNGIVSPRPIAWVSSVNAEGLVNLAPHSWFTIVSVSPPMIGFTSGTAKDTYRNIKQTKEFVVNVVTEELTEGMNLTAVNFPPGMSEMDEIGFERAPSAHVKPPRVKASPLQLECKLADIQAYGDAPSYFTVGEVVAFHVKEEVLNGKYIDPHLVKAVARMGGHYYSRTTDTFERPRVSYEEYVQMKKTRKRF